MPLDHTLAKRVNHLLFESEIGGLDIKPQVVTDDDVVKEIIVAIPLRDGEDSSKVEELVRNSVKGDYHLIINGTGVFRKHSSIADCGVTGRKLVVDFYGGNARIGGGAPFSKDGSKADLTLNLLVRYLAKKEAFKSGKAVETAIACCIGKKEIIVTSHILGADIVKSEHLSISPSELIDTFDLNVLSSGRCACGVSLENSSRIRNGSRLYRCVRYYQSNKNITIMTKTIIKSVNDDLFDQSYYRNWRRVSRPHLSQFVLKMRRR